MNKRPYSQKPFKDGHCYRKSSKSFANLGHCLIFLFLSVCFWTYTFYGLNNSSTYTESDDLLRKIVSWGGSLVFTVAAFYFGYVSLRDKIWPEKSRLAKSIKSQLPNENVASTVQQLYAIVDNDINANGKWFDNVAVGKEWVLGDYASYIPNIRIIIGRNEVVYRHVNGGTQATQVAELILFDDKRNIHFTYLNNTDEIEPLVHYISLCAPDAIVVPYSDFGEWKNKSDMEWQKMLVEFRRKQSEREMGLYDSEAQNKYNMVLTYDDGNVTSRVTTSLIETALYDCLKQGEGCIMLTPGMPLVIQGRSFSQMECYVCLDEIIENPTRTQLDELGMASLYLKAVSDRKDREDGLTLDTDVKSAKKILGDWFRGVVSELSDWEALSIAVPQQSAVITPGQETLPPKLVLVAVSGAVQSHTTFSMEDVRIGAEGIVDGTYQSVDLTLKGGYYWIRVQAGDKMDARCYVNCTKADGNKLRFFRTRCTDKEAVKYLTEYASGKFPEGKGWKDYTRQAVRKRTRR